MSPVVMAALAAVVLIAVIIGADLFRDVADQRADLTREQRQREDRVRAEMLADARTQRDLDIVASVFDPLGLFH